MLLVLGQSGCGTCLRPAFLHNQSCDVSPHSERQWAKRNAQGALCGLCEAPLASTPNPAIRNRLSMVSFVTLPRSSTVLCFHKSLSLKQCYNYLVGTFVTAIAEPAIIILACLNLA